MSGVGEFGFLAVNEADFAIPRCHITIWNVQGITTRQRFIIDLIVEVEALDVSVNSIRINLPFTVMHWADISASVVAESLPRWIPDDWVHSVEATVETSDPENVTPAILRVLGSREGATQSVLVNLREPIRSRTVRTISLRLHAEHSSFVLWRRSGFGINGLILDVGLSETSDTMTFVRPGHLALHFVLRAYLQAQRTYPSIEPTLVDRSDWEHYLDRDPDMRLDGSLVVMSHERELVAGGSDNFRVYVDASREFGLLPFGNYLRIAVASFVGAIIAINVRPIAAWATTTSGDLWEWGVANFPVRPSPGGGRVGLVASAIVILIAILGFSKVSRRRLHAAKIWFGRQEIRLFRLHKRVRKR